MICMVQVCVCVSSKCILPSNWLLIFSIFTVCVVFVFTGCIDNEHIPSQSSEGQLCVSSESPTQLPASQTRVLSLTRSSHVVVHSLQSDHADQMWQPSTLASINSHSGHTVTQKHCMCHNEVCTEIHLTAIDAYCFWRRQTNRHESRGCRKTCNVQCHILFSGTFWQVCNPDN